MPNPISSQTQVAQTGILRRPTQLDVPVLLIAAIGVTLAMLSFIIIERYFETASRHRFEISAANSAHSIAASFTRYLNEIDALGAFYNASDIVDRDEFSQFTGASLTRTHGMQALEWVPRVPALERSSYAERARQDGLPHFEITERNKVGVLVRAGKRDEFFPVYYVEPLMGNEAAVGFDLASNPARLAAMEKARNSGRMTVTERINLVQKSDSRAGALAFLPIYEGGQVPAIPAAKRQALKGFVLGVFRIDDAVEAIARGASIRGGTDVYLFDLSAPAGNRLLCEHLSAGNASGQVSLSEDDARKGQFVEHVFPVADRKWAVVLRPAGIGGSAFEFAVPYAAAAGVLTLTLLLGLFIYASRHRTHDIELQVRERTQALADSENSFRDFADTAADWFWEMGPDLRFTYMSERVETVTGVPVDFHLGKTREELGGESVEGEDWQQHFRDLREHKSFREFTFARKGPDGRIQHMSTSGTPVFDDNGVFAGYRGSARDITARVIAEAAVQENETRLQNLLNSSPIGADIVRPGGEFRFVNTRMAENFGMTREQFLLTNARDLYWDPDDRERIWSHVEEDGSVRNVEVKYRRADGSPMWALTTFEPAGTGDGTFFGWVYDITERKTAEQEAERARIETQQAHELLTNAVNSISDGFVFFDAEDRLVMFNERMREIFPEGADLLVHGVTFEEMVREGAARSQYVGFEEDKEAWIQQRLHRFHQGAGEMEAELGGDRWLRISERKTSDGGTVGIRVDITLEKRRERELRNARDELEQNVAELIVAKARADGATEAKSGFLANMSHEIRTPLNAVIGFSDLALRSDLNPKQQDFIEKIQSSGRLLLDLVNQVLDFSKIEAGKLELEEAEFDLGKVFQSISSVIATQAEEKGLELFFSIATDVPRRLIGDSTRLVQVLVNLTSNAVKFTEAGEVDVKVELEDQSDTRTKLRFSVSDTGIGLTQKEKAQLFEAFAQADGSVTRKYGGTGLGLTISRQIVELMGGEIDVDSEAGQGSTFWFTAVFGVSEGDAQSDRRNTEYISDLRILVVDDAAGHRELLCQALSTFPVEVEAVGSGQEALDALQQARVDGREPFDLVLLDWKMPNMDGIETANRIRQDHLEQQVSGQIIPTVIMVTAHDRRDISEQAQAAGISAFLLKPVTSTMLYETISNVLTRDELSAQPAQVGQDAAVAWDDALAGIRVLLVEDNEINRQVAVEMLRGAGANVTVAANGREAVQMVGASDSPFDTVLMDLQMPEMDGLEATRIIRKNHSADDTPIIAMTAHALSEERDNCAAAGMNDYLAKPVTSDSLVAMVAKWSARAADSPSGGGKGDSMSIDTAVVVMPDELPGIDVKAALAKFKVKPGLLARLMAKFHDRYTGLLAQLRAALAAEDLPAAEVLVHSLRGSAGYIGAEALTEMAGRLEITLRDGGTTDLDALVSEFEQELGVVLESTARFTAVTDP